VTTEHQEPHFSQKPREMGHPNVLSAVHFTIRTGDVGHPPNALNFTGDTQDILTGMYDTPNREFAGSNQGRWLSPDPAGAGWNQYAYVMNNPLSNVDPLGLDCGYGGSYVSGGCEEYVNTGDFESSDWFCWQCGWPIWTGGIPTSGSLPPAQHILPGQDCVSCFPLGLDPMQILQDVLSGNIWGALQGAGAIPLGNNCEFGICSPGGGNSFGPAAAAAGTIVCEIAEPCGAIEDVALLGVLAWESWQLYKFSKGGKQNIVPSWAEGARPNPGESASDFANRLCTQQYPPNGAGCGTGPGSERSKIQKWARDKFGI
jgi:RHS repeat-associated protein